MSPGLQPEEFFQAARERAAQLDVGRGDAVVERVRAAASALFTRMPEPPVYRRAEDPSRKAAQALLPEVEKVLAEALAAGRDPSRAPALEKLVAALLAHGEALVHTASGRLEAAETAWRRALELERAAHPTRHLVTAPPRPPPVFDKATKTSRYDPRPAPQASVKLVCPNTGCKRVGDYAFLTNHAYNRFVCPVCRTPFLAYFGELRGLEVEVRRSSKRYFFTVDEVGGNGSSRIEFEEASGQEFPAARRDLLAFLYTEARELKVVVNLTNQRLMWVSPASSCFVATVAFGEGAPELVAFRAYRDEVLGKSLLGRGFIRGYYRWGPDVARWVERRPVARSGVRWVLRRVHDRLTRSGYA
ncbi:CFI-box-CTERM domain-containing protein [Myxococcus stipitatus]|uniref:CFI-box-CTERM domain-containing protein n=1 Tax=Myxococcus stipitatus TaxID=83455 RepID=UPI002DD42CC8|nr:CFI-box-CTERM domain-containing protein [Myxococcus stipitatus]